LGGGAAAIVATTYLDRTPCECRRTAVLLLVEWGNEFYILGWSING
jgi:hypothetical protein